MMTTPFQKPPTHPLVWLRIVLLAIPLISLAGCHSHQLSRIPDRNFLVIAHRGAASGECENTVAGFQKALGGGANALEMDLSFTQDRVPVLWHDWSAHVAAPHEQTGACAVVTQSRAIDLMTWQEFRQQGGYTRHGLHMEPDTFSAFVEQVGRDERIRRVFLDLKLPDSQLGEELTPPFLDAVIPLLSKGGILHKIVFITPYDRIYQAFARHLAASYPDAAADLVLDQEVPETSLWHLFQGYPSSVDHNAALARQFNRRVRHITMGRPDALLSRWKFLRHVRREMSKIRESPSPDALHYVVWTINDRQDWIELIEAGVSGIMTDNAEALCRELAAWPGICHATAAPSGKQ